MQTVILDLSRKNIIPPVHAKQGDVGRKFKAVLTDAGVTYAIPRGAQFSVWYSGASGEGNYSAIGDTSAFTVEENVVTVELIAQMVTNSGTGTMCLVLNGADGSQIGMWNISYVVEAVPGMGSEEAEQHYTALSEVAEKAVRAAETFQTDTTMKVSGRAADAMAVGTALAGKAPAGYGLGEVKAKYVASPDDITGSGFYSSVAPGVTSGTAWYLCISYSDNAKTVLGFNEMSGGLAFMRTMKSGVWGEWDWVNPPMMPGVGYRTTERHNGKSVYTKLIDFGALPNADYSSVNIGVNESKVIGVKGLVKSSVYTEPFPPIASATGTAQLSWWISGSVLNIKTQGDMSNYTATVIIKYIND